MPLSRAPRPKDPPLPELATLEGIIGRHEHALAVQQLDKVEVAGRQFPLYVLSIGNPAPDVPVIGLFGGVHGIECIGTHVLLSFLANVLERLRWDRLLNQQLESLRMVFMPMVNPGGMWLRTRSNPHGVDLMRNSPVNCEDGATFLLGGQRFSPSFPWYRGAADKPMEAESQAVCDVVREKLLSAPFCIALDCHSGFGMRDRIWFPFAYSTMPIPNLTDIYVLQNLFLRAYPHHDYLFEPQCRQYMTHGDLWDYLYLEALRLQKTFLPLTLEMGSWVWVKKNPMQLFNRLGLFNPLPAHRLQRVLRRHLNWLNFLSAAAASYRNWLPSGEERGALHEAARAHWYKG
jgi:hypothetical protein